MPGGDIPGPPTGPIPGPPTGLLAVTKDRWTVYFESRIAKLSMDIDRITAVRRLFTYYDEWERCYRAVRHGVMALGDDGKVKKVSGRLVPGSTGQMVLNPLYKQMGTLEGLIGGLEEKVGITPLARLKLGITFGEAARSLEEMNRQLDADDDAEPHDDPRGDIGPSEIQLAAPNR
jgi:hypothetical protein